MARKNAITAELARFAAGVDYGNLPREVTERVKALVLDLTGIIIRARFDADPAPALMTTVQQLGLGGGNCTVLGEPARFAPPAAALINGALAHSLDFDDTHAPGSIHPSAPIVPAAFAAAEMTGANGKDAIAAIVAGYEIQIRLSLALVPSRHYARGFHPTATCGAFGAAAAAGKIFGLSARRLESAFGLCGSMAAGSLQFLDDGAWNKPFHTGYAAMNGLIAATAAAEDYRGAARSIEGRAGFLHAYTSEAVIENATAALGEKFETMSIAVKPYPSCRYGHAGIDAILALRARHEIDPAEVSSVEVGLSRTGLEIIGKPAAAKQWPRNIVDGQFSMPFVGAVALREGRMSWDDYRHHLDDPETLALCRRIHTTADPAAEAKYPANMSAIVRIDTNRGRFEQLVVTPKGEPGNFMSDTEFIEKFDLLTGPYLERERRNALSSAVLSLDSAERLPELLALTHSSTATSINAD